MINNRYGVKRKQAELRAANNFNKSIYKKCKNWGLSYFIWAYSNTISD